MTENQVNRILAIHRVLINDTNIKILRELRKNPKYILELEKNVDLDRSTIKRRLYTLVNLGLVKTKKRVTPKGGKAIYYELEDVTLPSINLYDLLDNADIKEIKELSKVYPY